MNTICQIIGWTKDAQWRRAHKNWLRKSQNSAFEMLQALSNQKKSQRDLAKETDVSPQQVNKWVKGRENFTLETISRLETALGVPLIHLARIDSSQIPSHSFNAKYEAISAGKGKIQKAEEERRVNKLKPSEYTTPKQTG